MFDDLPDYDPAGPEPAAVITMTGPTWHRPGCPQVAATLTRRRRPGRRRRAPETRVVATFDPAFTPPRSTMLCQTCHCSCQTHPGRPSC